MLKSWVAVLLSLVSMTAMAKSILVVGDSISAAYGIGVNQGWVNLLQQRLQAEHYDYTVKNESISGDTSAGGLARIDQALSIHKPSAVIIELGANDGLRGLSPLLLKSNLAEMIRRAKQAGAKIVLLSMQIPPNYGKRYTDLFYNVYPELAKEMGVVSVPFILEDIALKKDLMQEDGLHPNAKAQAIIVDKIWPFLMQLIK